MRLSQFLSLAMLVAGGLLVGWIWFGNGGVRPGGGQMMTSLLRSDDAKLVARGAEIYARACASCHGANLEGQVGWRSNRKLAPPHDESGHTWHHPDQMLFQVVKHGSVPMGGSMPGFKGMLMDEEIIAVLSYIKSRWPRRIREAHDAINARGARG